MAVKKHRRRSPFQIIILGFLGVIFAGALVLMLPISSQSGMVTPFSEALFTSTSAVCVTGLVVQDTATYWSEFGQNVIMILIQIGGLGVVTVAASLALLSGRKISLVERSTMQEAISAPEVGGIVNLTKFILAATLGFEAIGAIAMLPVFVRDYGMAGIRMAIFHSVSAFCNAGFDILGTADAPFQSLTSYVSSPVINITIMLLIIIGGIGFLTWEDIKAHKLQIKRYRMQTKVILVTTAALVILPAVWFFFMEYQDLPMKERILGSFFQSVTPRTAGFNTMDMNAMSDSSKGLMIMLMMIGGSPGSTAGGIKTTTFAVLIMNAIAIFRRKEDTEVFGRRLDNGVIRSASTVLMMHGFLSLGGAFLISAVEGLPFSTCLFETGSAVGTVGLTLGITPGLGLLSRVVLIVLMFLGRVGGITLVYATYSESGRKVSKLPLERIAVG